MNQTIIGFEIPSWLFAGWESWPVVCRFLPVNHTHARTSGQHPSLSRLRGAQEGGVSVIEQSRRVGVLDVLDQR